MSKILLIICLCGIIVTIINGITGFLNSAITTNGGTLICIIAFGVAMLNVITLENNRIKKNNKDKE